ncbi:hypothetical protein FJV41_17255 [Myxococcus llanfairpwllgwyngyllgogerychwyrndrobwllllantysiliogogogochensis]|uniref:Uncharacterized protein n=1 Tax=Myxococcus llanfairpwllgwyngyllgogerychwyrndrobwllllantysiliogogogochensis TaxID=2590453 RepID=A0A540X0I1_9BACT|nr:hypothetical protein [Myxococcus llanfairpwllgwyngyllgogerychwyrndrobwllllantysiliogogogochensis]TQF14742.1 hypothetical protein FJV41_17255 [Myxococcus llanfairpwllgwyngyllgogerychwyrndrobwllllantysiliogogogochensis]
MAVVINEMEVVSAPPVASTPSGGGAGGSAEGGASAVQKAHEQERAQVLHRERHARVRAH